MGGKDPGLYLVEHKTKGDIDERKVARQLLFDLQTMLYLTALQEEATPSIERTCYGPEELNDRLIKGVLYNVVRRPLSGGKYSIIRHKATKTKNEETKTEYYDRLQGLIREDPDWFFMRWRVEVRPADVERFKRECLNPILEQLCDWWSWVEISTLRTKGSAFDYDAHHGYGAIHWRHPFGVYNVLDEGGSSDLDEYLESGSEAGLRRATTLFPELERT
jgi:hypothetical protein